MKQRVLFITKNIRNTVRAPTIKEVMLDRIPNMRKMCSMFKYGKDYDRIFYVQRDQALDIIHSTYQEKIRWGDRPDRIDEIDENNFFKFLYLQDRSNANTELNMEEVDSILVKNKKVQDKVRSAEYTFEFDTDDKEELRDISINIKDYLDANKTIVGNIVVQNTEGVYLVNPEHEEIEADEMITIQEGEMLTMKKEDIEYELEFNSLRNEHYKPFFEVKEKYYPSF